jgi:hypothetical protein
VFGLLQARIELATQPEKRALSPPAWQQLFERLRFISSQERAAILENGNGKCLDNFMLHRLIRDDVFLDHEQKLLLFLLATYRNVHTLECSPSLDRLAVNYNRSKRTVQRLLSRLESKLYIVSIRRGYGKKANFYFMWDFLDALSLSRERGFQGDKFCILKANRKRYVLAAKMS